MIQVLFSKELTSAICWTLVHSLWQGLILALVTGVTMIATRKSEARKRYRLLVALFMVFVTVSIATFFMEWQHATALAEQQIPAAAGYSSTDNAVIVQVVTDDNTATYNQQLISRMKDYLDNNASLIVTLWMIIFLARFVQFTGELVYVQRLKHHRVVPVSGYWRRKLALLAEKLDLGKPIRLLESGMVKVPVVMGVLKPVILLPAGLITRLPEDEIEAILLHELAHIKRIDYFVNLLQRFAETLFFFNPALLWLSSMIREERENCCDDIAVSVTNNKTHFINALISFQEYNLSNKNYAMTFPGKKNHLLNRAKRLIDSRNKTLNTTEKSFLSLGMGLLLVFSFATARTVTPVDKKATEEQTVAAHHEIDTVYAGGEKSISSFSAVAEEHAASDIMDTVPVAPKRKAVPATTPAAPAAPSVPGSPAAVPAAPAVAPRSSVPADVVAPVPPVPPAISSDFSSKSTNSHTVDKNRELTVEATSRDGHDYRLRKTNDQIKELVIDGVKIDPASYKDYKELIDKLDSPDDGRRSMDFNKSEWKKTKPRGKGDNAEAGASSVPDKFTMGADVNMQRTKANTDAKWEGKAE
ncbi:M56 family metallopeptidase [Sediminibacterium ginsengisoli]|uniref:Signal transducer regulating beta-lactamase production, contains metallopeptidase domain n=1 Tax=Sediminibacterium ginsengisoli TaxID=413434 RepID=A0A1T4K9R4_9BACT|nr:M56 family metallopeptidase [Sediminibacterium ginsengisoli]SJZ39182.1 Signal transducer regulating beta-lactamase production, contains metallopeptidase domain [Sediminibacterium ginsengisoli]